MNNKFKGLNNKEVETNRKKYGSNKLAEHISETFFQKFLGNFDDPMIKILVVALIINIVFVFLGESKWYEPVVIAVTISLVTYFSTKAEYSNEVSFKKLQAEASLIKVKTYRNGKIEEVLIDDIVHGDLVVLQSGDKIPADGKLISGSLKVDQSSLNGESEEAKKEIYPINYNNDDDSDDLLNKYKIFRGTVVVSGEAVMEVTCVGDKSIYGKLSKEMEVEERKSPLQVKLGKLADDISTFGKIGSVLIAVAFLIDRVIIENSCNMTIIKQHVLSMGMIKDIVSAIILAVTIVIMAVPEGLPMVIAMVLGQNMKKMLKDNVLVRKLIGIETAGSLNILFSDKTGTITKGKLEVVHFGDGENNTYNNYKEIPEQLRRIVNMSIANNTGAMYNVKDFVVGGNATDRAVLQYINKNEIISMEKIDEETFSSDKKYSSSTVKTEFDELKLIKGAPEKILEKCKYYYDEDGNKKQFNLNETNIVIDKLANKAIRVIALAVSEKQSKSGELPEDLIFVGILGIRDDVRPESIQAIKEVQKAGVQVVMITGDRKETAVAIAKDAGLLKKENEIVLTSDELKKLSDDELKTMLPNIRVIARALPMDKSRLVKIAQQLDLVVGMTGDGVNDAPALKNADVGFAMGSGTEVAKEAGDIVILDDNFKSISKTILYGRTIFNSIRKFIVFQLTINVSAVLTSFVAPFLGVDYPLSVVQILWVNLVMDTLGALAFGGEPALERFMQESPKKRSENIVSKNMWSQILVNGLFIFGFGLIFLKAPFMKKIYNTNDLSILTGYFTMFILISVVNGFNARTEKLNLFDHISQNKGFLKVMALITIIQVAMTFVGGEVLRTTPMTLIQWGIVIFTSVLIIPIDLIRKVIVNK